jgi:hypothetical protein
MYSGYFYEYVTKKWNQSLNAELFHYKNYSICTYPFLHSNLELEYMESFDCNHALDWKLGES